MNSERPPESASSTPTGPGGSEGLQEGLGYFLFEFWRPFKHVNAFHVPVPSKDNMLPSRPLPPPPAAEARRQRVARAAARAVARVVAVWRTRPTLRRRPQRPILDQSRRSDGGGVAAAGDLPLDHAADPSTSTRGLPIEKKEKDGGASGARGRSGRGSGRGRARGNPASGGDNASGGSAGGARRAPRRSPARS